MNIRVGMGYDVHRLEAGRELWLGGMLLEAPKGAVGHSDADVLIHAICDALLGAANLRDIGYHFPDKDPKWKGKDSAFFLEGVTRLLEEKGWHIVNVDSTICLEVPKVGPHVAAMKSQMAPLMHVDVDAVSIKATTSELMGFVGRTEGIAAHAVALIARKD